MKLSIGFSPCPNDTFIFDALVNGLIDTQGLEFEPFLEDVQTLNAWATEGKLDISKLSFPALFNQQFRYAILNAGSALGKGVGPLLISKTIRNAADVADCKIAVPGENTTANFLLNYAFPQATNKVTMLFSAIEDAVVKGEVDLGVIIHENRFTYQQKGLHKVCDLGEVWESRENVPIPLGCIAVKRDYPVHVQQKISQLIKKSLEFSFAHYPQLSSYVVQHAQAMEEKVMRKHIELYVNNYSLDLGEEGKTAINKLHQVYRNINTTQSETNLFISGE